ncbi:MAG: O-antigen ligase family protein [Flavobacteriaceae bacterium]|nr:O-antigen ligase family protein [Flavobacteriaceae bacterium]
MKSNKLYIILILLQIVLGAVVYLAPVASKLIFLSAVIYFLIKIFTAPSSKMGLHILFASAYFVGAETFFRMTGGSFLYESSKYLVIIFMFIGVVFRGISTRAYPYFIYIILLLPSIVVAAVVLDYDLNFRTSVTFVLSGPICLGVSALFLCNRNLTKEELLEVMGYIGLPIVMMTTYLFLYTPSLQEVVTGTGSNFASSGGFGPNQVSTILGLGAFVFTVRFFIKSPNLWIKTLNGVLVGVVFFRAIVTFSRGGVLTGFIMILAFLAILYLSSSTRQRQSVAVTLILFAFLGLVTWSVSSSQTSGMIDKRYANQDAAGRTKEDASTGRSDLFLGELQGFVNNPFFGVGANGMKQYRFQSYQGIMASHNEISRLLAEHGFLGIIMLIILIFKPLMKWVQNRSNIFLFAFLCFWFATINHSAMRLAAPGFVYALSLLNIVHGKRSLHRKSITA